MSVSAMLWDILAVFIIFVLAVAPILCYWLFWYRNEGVVLPALSTSQALFPAINSGVNSPLDNTPDTAYCPTSEHQSNASYSDCHTTVINRAPLPTNVPGGIGGTSRIAVIHRLDSTGNHLLSYLNRRNPDQECILDTGGDDLPSYSEVMKQDEEKPPPSYGQITN